MTVDFAGLGLRPELVRSIASLGYTEPTPIQAETIPHLLEGVDLVGQAATGTGKTAAFALPIVNKIIEDQSNGQTDGETASHRKPPQEPVALVVTPTRELAVQVSEAIAGYGSEQRLSVLAVYGGSPIYQQIKALRRGVHVVVGTPGRAIDLIKRKSLDLSRIATVVLDEADEMLDMGFAEDIETILESTPANRQTVLFSATMPPRINAIASRHQSDPVRIKVGLGSDAPAKALVRQTVYMVKHHHKSDALGRIIDIEAPESTLVFCRTRSDVDQLTVTMNTRGYRAEALHGGMDQNQRDRVMGRLRNGTANLLVATDVAARGLDVDTLTHVVNYDVPAQPESYVHRIGRVGRAGREGVAITLAEPSSRSRLRNIERVTSQKLTVADVPSVEDLRARQLELTVAAIKEGLGDDVDQYHHVIHQLNDVADLRDVALAAIKLVHESRNPVSDDKFIPPRAESKHHQKTKGAKSGKYQDKGHGKSYGKSQGKYQGKGKRHDRSGRDDADNRGRQFDENDGAFVYIGVGRRGHVRPGDLVGAIANETGLTGGDIGPIRITEHYSVVGVPPAAVKDVVSAINGSSIRGRRAKARPYTP